MSQMSRNNRSNSPFGQQRSIQGGGSRDIIPSPIKPKDIQENQQLDDEFVNVMLEVEQKYTILSKHERIRIEQWTKKLCTVTTNKIWKKNRNLYAKELLSMVIASKLREPFTRMPPDGPLPKFNKYDIVSQLFLTMIPNVINCLYKPQEKPKKSDPFLIREDMGIAILDQRQRSINSHHVNYNHQNLTLNNSQQRSHSNLHQNHQQQNINVNQQTPQHQQQQFQYYGTASFNQNEHNNIQQNIALQDQNIFQQQNQINQGFSISNQLNQENVKRSSRSNSVVKKVIEENQIIQQQAEQIKQLQIQLQITESKYTNQVQNYQEDMKNIDQQYKNQINEIQQIFNQQNQTLNQKIEENNQLQQQVQKLRNILSNIGIQIIHIKDTLPQQQSQQLDEIVKQLSSLNTDKIGLNAKEQSDLNVQFTYLNDTNENYASPQSNIYNDGSSHHLAQPINNSVVSKQQMSPNIRSKHQSSNLESSLNQNSVQNNILAPTKQQTPTGNQLLSPLAQIEGNLTNRSKKSNQNLPSQIQNQVASNFSNDKGSSYNILSSRTSSRPNAIPSNKNSLNQINKYFPSMSSQRSNLNNLLEIQNETPQQIYQNQQQIQHEQVYQNQNIQAQPIQQFQNPGVAINTNFSQNHPQISTRYEKSPNQSQNKYADPMPITLKNEQETQEFLNYLDNFQKRTEKLKNETSQYLKVNEKYIQPVKK